MSISLDHPDEKTGAFLLMKALGIADEDFFFGLLTQLTDASSAKGQAVNERLLNFLISAIKSIDPQDEIETMLSAQMAVVHVASMTFARRLNRVETIPQQDSAERALNKLARTFTSQMEALNRHRGKGQQKVTVEHVHVHSGGQAVVGLVEQPGGGDCPKSEDQPHAKQIAHSPQPEMRRTDTEREPVPIASDGERPLPDARGKVTRRPNR
ncbi:MAG: hypothetical protein WD852_05860 [Methyloceanibacter sp.]